MSNSNTSIQFKLYIHDLAFNFLKSFYKLFPISKIIFIFVTHSIVTRKLQLIAYAGNLPKINVYFNGENSSRAKFHHLISNFAEWSKHTAQAGLQMITPISQRGFSQAINLKPKCKIN